MGWWCLFASAAGVGRGDGAHVVEFGQANGQVADGVFAMDMEGDLDRPGSRGSAWLGLGEGLGGHVVDGEAPGGGLAQYLTQDAVAVGVADADGGDRGG